MSTDQNTTPDIPPTPEDMAEEAPGYVGTLEEQEFNTLRALQQASSQLMYQIGQLEVQKSNLLRAIQDKDDQAQALMNKAAERFGVEQGQGWNVGPDRKVYTGMG